MLSLLDWRLWRLFAILRFNIVYRPYCLTDIRLPPPPAILKLSFLRQAVNHTIIKQIPNLIKGAGVSWVKLFPDVSCNAVLKQMSKLEKKNRHYQLQPFHVLSFIVISENEMLFYIPVSWPMTMDSKSDCIAGYRMESTWCWSYSRLWKWRETTNPLIQYAECWHKSQRC